MPVLRIEHTSAFPNFLMHFIFPVRISDLSIHLWPFSLFVVAVALHVAWLSAGFGTIPRASFIIPKRKPPFRSFRTFTGKSGYTHINIPLLNNKIRNLVHSRVVLRRRGKASTL